MSGDCYGPIDLSPDADLFIDGLGVMYTPSGIGAFYFRINGDQVESVGADTINDDDAELTRWFFNQWEESDPED